jgi:hypothetical protein
MIRVLLLIPPWAGPDPRRKTMKKLALALTALTALVAGAGFAQASPVGAAQGLPSIQRAADGRPLPQNSEDSSSGDLNNINATYRGRALLQHVQVSTLFMGQDWQSSPYTKPINGFFQALFADGRYMNNLAQYSAGGYQIGNGSLVATTIDHRPAAAKVSDDEIQAEVALAIQYHALPPAGPDSLYVVYTAPGTVVVQSDGSDSVNNFAGYHGYVTDSPVGAFAYAVVAYPDDPYMLTACASHELAEAVTDPQVNAGTLGWYDDNNGELGDIPVSMFYAGIVDEAGYLDILTGQDGSQYVVQKIWSNRDEAPVAFSESTR